MHLDQRSTDIPIDPESTVGDLYIRAQIWFPYHLSYQGEDIKELDVELSDLGISDGAIIYECMASKEELEEYIDSTEPIFERDYDDYVDYISISCSVTVAKELIETGESKSCYLLERDSKGKIVCSMV